MDDVLPRAEGADEAWDGAAFGTGVGPARVKILILTSSTGGGHDMRARSLRQWMELPENASDWECRVHQALESTHGLYRFGVGLYNWIQKTWPLLHHIYFNVLEGLGATRKGRKLLGRERFIALLEDFRPEVVLSTHGHLNHAFFEVARETLGRDRVRCVTYCGELFGGYGFARGWVNPGADAFIGAVDATCEAARKRQMPGVRVSRGGFLLHPDFFRPPEPNEKDRLFRELNLDPTRFTLLLATGANGANNHRACIAACDRAGLRIQIIALCGKNEKARLALADFPLVTTGLAVRTLGYTGDMPRLLRSVSVVFARPGTGTTSEAILCGCPVLFNAIGGIMPQEGITVRFARERGIWLGNIRRPSQLAKAVAALEDEGLQGIRKRMQKINCDRTPRDILQTLHALKREQSPTAT